jgi:hypothetical protein
MGPIFGEILERSINQSRFVATDIESSAVKIRARTNKFAPLQNSEQPEDCTRTLAVKCCSCRYHLDYHLQYSTVLLINLHTCAVCVHPLGGFPTLRTPSQALVSLTCLRSEDISKTCTVHLYIVNNHYPLAHFSELFESSIVALSMT